MMVLEYLRGSPYIQTNIKKMLNQYLNASSPDMEEMPGALQAEGNVLDFLKTQLCEVSA
jgi:hypothetical protein